MLAVNSTHDQNKSHSTARIGRSGPILSSTALPGANPGARGTEPLTVALLNNMPDAALEATETQFGQLLRLAAGAHPVELRCVYLPEVPRGEVALERVRRTYWSIEELLRSSVDALIVTGLEPLARRLPDEPYWRRLCDVLDWAEARTHSSVWSCLAAHAAVHYLDGIERIRLERKRCGVFEHAIATRHPLLEGIAGPVAIPHSRWNDLPVEALKDAGYPLLTHSPETGADAFVKQRRSLMLFMQGHPEYEAATLLREYRRDVGRFLRERQPHYPDLPQGYFSVRATQWLEEFRARALAERDAALLGAFPSSELEAEVAQPWRDPAIALYRNWMAHVRSAKHAAGMASQAR
jgi:homoserine O-succinyltransferase/O-acetyltransferase